MSGFSHSASSPRASRRPLARGEKWLFVGCPILLLGVAGVALWGNAREATPVIHFPHQRPLPKPNGYDLYVKAARITTTFNPLADKPSVDAVEDAAPPQTARLRAQRYSLARRRAWINAHAAGFVVFQQALNTPSVYPKVNDNNFINTDFAKFRQLARNQVKLVNTFKLEHQWGAAAQTGLETIQMGGDISRGGSLMAKLVGSAVIAVGRVPLEDCDALPDHLSAKEARDATKRLESIIAHTSSYTEAIQEERWRTLAAFLQASEQPNWRSTGNQTLSGDRPTWRQLLTSRLITKTEIVHRINAKFDALLLALKRPYSAPFDDQSGDLDVISEQFGFSSPLLRKSQAREQVGLRLLLLRFALRAYQAEHGTFPISLNQLAPAYLQRVPTDDYADDKPFHYVLRGRSYKLWSVGPDGTDNGGKPVSSHKKLLPGAPPTPASVSFDSKGDWVAGLNR